MEITTTEALIGVGYLVVSLLVSIEASLKGYSFMWAMFASILCTPLIGAIMFSNYRQTGG